LANPLGPFTSLGVLKLKHLSWTGLSRSLERYTFPVQVARLDDLSPDALLDLLLPEPQISI